MTNEEMTTFLARNGIAAADIEKIQETIDIEKISYIVEAASSPESAFEAIHAFYPDLEVEELQKQCDFVLKQVELSMKEQNNMAAIELTEDELEMVSGGGLFDSIGTWFKENWRAVAVTASIAAGAILVASGAGVLVGAAVTGVGLLGTFIANELID